MQYANQFFHKLLSLTLPYRCHDSSVVRFLRIDPVASGSNPTSPKLLLSAGRASRSL